MALGPRRAPPATRPRGQRGADRPIGRGGLSDPRSRHRRTSAELQNASLTKSTGT
jgi:hypothetical protein